MRRLPVIGGALVAVLLLAGVLTLPYADRADLHQRAEQAVRELDLPAGWGTPVREDGGMTVSRRYANPGLGASAAVVVDRARTRGWSAGCGGQCLTHGRYTMTVEDPCRPGTPPCRVRVAVTWTGSWPLYVAAFPLLAMGLVFVAAMMWAGHRRRTARRENEPRTRNQL